MKKRSRSKKILVIFVIGLGLFVIGCAFSIVDDVVAFMAPYPNASFRSKDEVYFARNHIGQHTWYTTSDSPDVVINWFDQNGWSGDLDTMPYFGGRNINFGIFKIGQSIILYEDSHSHVTVIQVYQSIYLPYLH